MENDLTDKAKNQAQLLERTTKVVAWIAVVVYLIMSVVAAINQAWIAIVFFTCLMLGVRVVYLLIQTSLAHFELIRNKD
jgi:membrane protein YdbS with pleckstrin-like domain